MVFTASPEEPSLRLADEDESDEDDESVDVESEDELADTAVLENIFA